jgi:hypothetical protein
MPAALGPRFLIEAGFIIAVAVVAGVERFRTVTIVIVMAAAWLAVAGIELVFARRRRVRAEARPVDTAATAAAEEPRVEPKPVAPTLAVRVLRAEQPAAEPTPAPEPEVTPGPRPETEPEPAPEEPPAPEPPRPIPQQPRIAAVPPVPRVPEPEPEPEPVSSVVPLAPRRTEPREWNVWELERLVREQSGADVARDEERSYLLMYLREFANSDGHLPADFDGVVRETFGDELDAIPF